MRGCGKTMLLRSLQFHARAFQRTDDGDAESINRLQNDGFVGLFVSASSLLTVDVEQVLDTENMFARLAVAYSLEAARSLAHLEDIEHKAISPRSAREIQSGLESILQGVESSDSIDTVQQLERHLVSMLNHACRSDSVIKMAIHPTNGFPLLAEHIRKCAAIWSDSQVLFLLDDVSTRYLNSEKIEEILSALIFQHPSCAFKLTSETQTIFLTMKSPGGVEPAAHSRDFDTFDLGAEVHKRLKQTGGKKFLAEILQQRARFFSEHPSMATPEKVLGDQSLSAIASAITTSKPNSRARKSVYHGLQALRAVCVGDIGSAITIYQNILKRANGTFPINKENQSEAFQDFCSNHLYLLDRRDSYLKSVAKSFAAASYELLIQSAKKKEKRGLRQYSSIYVRVTAGDREEQGKRLRGLVDAGVFVFQGGAPRTKTKDSDPVQQFKLTFRKIYGLADFIGLAERDRFELSGADLEEWLNKPDQGAQILMRNLSTEEEEYVEDDFKDEPPSESSQEEETRTSEPKNSQGELLLQNPAPGVDSTEQLKSADLQFGIPKIAPFDPTSANQTQTDVLYLALGFEDRASVSVSRALTELSPKSVVAIRYPEKGHSDEIIADLRSRGVPYSVVDYADLRAGNLGACSTNPAIDITGLTKAAIFQLIVFELRNKADVTIVYTEADEYYPLESDLAKILNAQSDKDYDALLTELKGVLTGEEGPYTHEVLHSLVTDETRLRALFAHGSAKHERLIHLVEQRDYDQVKVLVDSSKTARATVAKLAAEVAVRGADAGSIEQCDIRDPIAVLSELEQVYERTYVKGGLNLEIGLTGDKLEAVAVAAFCSVMPVNYIWYVKPAVFDPERFSRGVKGTKYFQITNGS